MTTISPVGIKSTEEEKAKAVTASHKRPNGIQTLHSILYDKSTSLETSTTTKVIHVAAKALLCFLCYTQTVGLIEAPRRNFNNKILQEIFAYGDCFAWGTLSTWCALNLYSAIIENKHLSSEKTINKRAFITYWAVVIALGLASEIPAAYKTYYYDGDLFWCIYTPLIASFFCIQSNHELFQELSYSDNFITRLIYSRDQVKIKKLQKSFYKQINACYQSLSQQPNIQFQAKIVEIDTTTKDMKKIIGIALSTILKEGSTYQKEKRLAKSTKYPLGEKLVKIGATFAPLGNPILEGILTYKGYRLILDKTWPLPFIIFLAVAPDIYLQVKLSQKFYCNLFNKLTRVEAPTVQRPIIRLQSKVALNPRYLFVALFTIFGLASDTTFVRDNLSFDHSFSLILGASVISTMAIILITSMNSMFKDFESSLQQRKRTVAQIEYDSFLNRIESLGSFIEHTSTDQFVALLEEIPLEDSDITIAIKEKTS